MVQMYEIVSLVEAYPEFVPWCKESVVAHRGRATVRCKLTVGFPPLLEERYTSVVTLDRPHLVKVINEVCSVRFVKKKLGGSRIY